MYCRHAAAVPLLRAIRAHEAKYTQERNDIWEYRYLISVFGPHTASWTECASFVPYPSGTPVFISCMLEADLLEARRSVEAARERCGQSGIRSGFTPPEPICSGNSTAASRRLVSQTDKSFLRSGAGNRLSHPALIADPRTNLRQWRRALLPTRSSPFGQYSCRRWQPLARYGRPLRGQM